MTFRLFLKGANIKNEFVADPAVQMVELQHSHKYVCMTDGT